MYVKQRWIRLYRSQSYQTLFFFIFWFCLLSLAILLKIHFFICYKHSSLTAKNRRTLRFRRKKSLVGSTPGLKHFAVTNKSGEKEKVEKIQVFFQLHLRCHLTLGGLNEEGPSLSSFRYFASQCIFHFSTFLLNFFLANFFP